MKGENVDNTALSIDASRSPPESNARNTDQVMTSRRGSDNSGNSQKVRGSNPQDRTPLPWKRIALLGCILAANNSSIWMIFSFLPFMVHKFYPELSTKELGFKAGIMGSAFSSGSFMGNFMWGVLSDKIGRRPALMYGLMGTAVSATCFGFSPYFWLAVFSRFMWGFLNGNIGVSKTYMGEILDDSNTARGMAMFGVIGGIGRTIGPIIGGFLAMPADHYKVFKGTIFETFPFALPSLVIAANCLIILTLTYFELPETLKRITNKSKGSKKTQDYVALNIDEEESHGLSDNGNLEMIALNSSSNNSNNSHENSPTATESPMFSRDYSTTNSEKHGIKKRKVTFSSVTYVKEVDSSVVEYGKLNNVHRDDVPLSVSDGAKSPLHSRVNFNNSNRNRNITLNNNNKSLSEDSHSSLCDEDEQSKSLLSSPNRDDIALEIDDSLNSNSNIINSISSNTSDNNHSNSISNSNNSLDEDSMEIDSDTNEHKLPEDLVRYSNGSELVNMDEFHKMPLWRLCLYLLRRKEVYISTALYGLNGFVQLAMNEIIPLWVVTSREDGGFAFDSHLIGIVTMISGPITIFTQVTLYPYLVEKYGILKVYIFGSLLFAFTVFLMPMISIFNDKSDSWVVWCGLVFLFSMINASAMWVMISVFVLINNSCYSHERGTVNAIGQSFASLGRLSGPYIGATIFAWSEVNGQGWPFNYYFSFYLIGGFSLIIAYLARSLPRSIQRRKREPKNPRYALSMTKNRGDDEDEDSK